MPHDPLPRLPPPTHRRGLDPPRHRAGVRRTVSAGAAARSPGAAARGADGAATRAADAVRLGRGMTTEALALPGVLDIRHHPRTGRIFVVVDALDYDRDMMLVGLLSGDPWELVPASSAGMVPLGAVSVEPSTVCRANVRR